MKANWHYECISTFLQERSPFANKNEDLIPRKPPIIALRFTSLLPNRSSRYDCECWEGLFMRKIVFAVVAGLVVACAKSPESIASAYVSDITYRPVS